MQPRQQIPDRVLMYASVFSYQAMERYRFINYAINEDKLRQFQGSGAIPANSLEVLQKFTTQGDEEQRDWLSSGENCKSIFTILIKMVSSMYGEPDLVYFALALLNGILEDKRDRIVHLKFLQNSKNQNTHVDAIGILNSYLLRNTDARKAEFIYMRDLAAHTLSHLICEIEAHNCQNVADAWLYYVLDSQGDNSRSAMLSARCMTNCLMFLVKSNSLAKKFIEKRGFSHIEQLLKNDCLQNEHIAYNVLCTLWILSYHKESLVHFADFSYNIIELVAKILDFFNKEKIVRVITMLFGNLKNDNDCMECLSMVNALNIVMKLQNRPWVDKDISTQLEDLFNHFDQNYHEFSTFERWKKQILKGQLAWSPVHTEKFWQTAFVNFHEADNLECMKKVIAVLDEQVKDPNDRQAVIALETKKAVALYDIGEFSRFFPMGRGFLETAGARPRIAAIMGNPESSPELKKEAITCYQKILMKSWGQNN